MSFVLYEDILTVREGVFWSDYRRALQERGDHSGPRIAVWRHGELTAHVLRDDTYEVSESRALPGIDLAQIAGLMDQPTTSDAILAYHNLLRNA